MRDKTIHAIHYSRSMEVRKDIPAGMLAIDRYIKVGSSGMHRVELWLYIDRGWVQRIVTFKEHVPLDEVRVIAGDILATAKITESLKAVEKRMECHRLRQWKRRGE